ncbi:MAG: DUF3341 domain-containing protein [Chitinophagaceae bacterium]
MAKKKFVVGSFMDEAVLFPAVKRVRQAGFKIHDVYTPYPVHGLDKALGLRETSLHTAGFIYGMTGTTIALSFMGWVFTTSWPLNIGGKPHFPLPAFVPVTFEFTVLCAAVGMVLTFCYLCQLSPFLRKHQFHLRATDDLFVMVIECTGNTTEADATNLLQNAGAQEINTQMAEPGWWLGTYDKDRKLYEDNLSTAH